MCKSICTVKNSKRQRRKKLAIIGKNTVSLLINRFKKISFKDRFFKKRFCLSSNEEKASFD